MDKVITCFSKRPDALVRLICFPWAGGGSIHYARWAKTLNCSIEGNFPTLNNQSNKQINAFNMNINSIFTFIVLITYYTTKL